MFEERLRVRFQYLTKTQKQIAEFLLNNAEEAAFQSISGLAEALNTSTSNIFRLAKAIGYSGYPELQSDLQKKIRQKISPVKALENSREKDKGKDIYSIIFDMDAKNLASTQELNSKETIDRAVKEIIAARFEQPPPPAAFTPRATKLGKRKIASPDANLDTDFGYIQHQRAQKLGLARNYEVEFSGLLIFF